MADGLSTGLPEGLRDPSHRSAWAPFREPLFRSLWVAAVVSYTGTWMQNVGAGWLMTQLTTSPLKISLVTAAATLPVFLVILPAGALADIVDRRRFLLITQGWMVLASGLLGILTLTSCIGPWTLLLFTFFLGLGAVMNDPAWQAITPEIVCPQNHAAAVALNSVGFNVARAVGPALGGILIAATSSGFAFLLNAVSFFGVIFVLYRWRRPHYERVETGDVRDALLTGLRYVRDAPAVKSVLVRTGAFSLAASSLLSLMPIIARPFGASGYGMLLGSFGLGALAGAAALPYLRGSLSVDGVVGAGIVVFCSMPFTAGPFRTLRWVLPILFASGIAWIGILACLNVAPQTMSPSYLRARSLSMYLLVLQGGMALGSALWGALATSTGVQSALLWSAITLMAGLLTVRRHRLPAQNLELSASAVRD